MEKDLIINLNVKVRLNDDAKLQEVLENSIVSFEDTTGKADLDQASILNYIEVGKTY